MTAESPWSGHYTVESTIWMTGKKYGSRSVGWSGGHLILVLQKNWATAWDFQQCGVWDQQSLRSACAYAQSDQCLCLWLQYPMSVKLLTDHHLRFLSLKRGCTGLSESTHVKIPHCWKSRHGSIDIAHSITFLANSEVWFQLTQRILKLHGKQCGSWSDGFVRSQLNWIYIVF